MENPTSAPGATACTRIAGATVTLDDTRVITTMADGFYDFTGVTPRLVSSSTDANVPMALGVPSIAMGVGGVFVSRSLLMDAEFEQGFSGAIAVAFLNP